MSMMSPVSASPLSAAGMGSPGMGSKLRLNTATHTGARMTAGARPIKNADRLGDTVLWENATETMLKKAADNAEMSSSLRNTSKQANKQIDQETRECHDNVNAFLKKKVTATTTLKSKLEKTIAALSQEMSALARRRQLTSELLQMQQQPLLKAQHRLAQRGSRRPMRENIADPVQASLLDEASDIQAALEKLQEAKEEMTSTFEQMKFCKETLQLDHRDKVDALSIDKSCLAVPGKPQNKAGGDVEANGFVRRVLADAMSAADLLQSRPQWPVQSSNDPMTENGDVRHLARHSRMHPSQWSNHTQANIEIAQGLMRDSRHLRQRVTQYSKQAVQQNTLKGERTCQELEAKIKHTTQLSAKLQSRLDEIDQELADVRSQQAAINAALQDKQAPLHVCARRLALRRRRPERERVRDDAEITLQAQLDHLIRNCRNLEQQAAALLARERELCYMRDQLDADRRDKDSARDLDTELLTIDPAMQAHHHQSRHRAPSPFGAPPVYQHRPPSSCGGRTPSSLASGRPPRPGSAPPGKRVPLAAY